MNRPQDFGGNDKTLKDGLDKLSQQYGKLEQDEPPELLDMAIRKSAHRALESKPRRVRFGWIHGLATAAVFVLAFSIVLDQRAPAPVFENGLGVNPPAPLQTQKAARKQPGDLRTEYRKELKTEDILTNAKLDVGVASTPESEALTSQPRTRGELQERARSADNDMEADELMLEEVISYDAAVLADSQEPDDANMPSAAAAKAGPREALSQAKEYSQAEAEKALEVIIKLKQSDNPAWKTQLETFIETYPNYPLPDDLRKP